MTATVEELHRAVRDEIESGPQPVQKILEDLQRRFPVDREELVAAIWDVVEDDQLIYTARATLTRA